MLLYIVGIIVLILLIRKAGIGVSLNGGFDKQLRHAIVYCYLWAWKRYTGPMFGFEQVTRDLKKLGIKALPESELREAARPLESDLCVCKSTDTVGFCGTSNDGNSLIVRVVRRHDRCAEIVVHLRLNTGDVYEHPVHPDCHVSNTDGRSFSAGGLSFDVLEPLMRWRITFNGILRKAGKRDDEAETKKGIDNIVPVKFSFIWKPMNNYIGFPHDLDASIMSKTMVEQNKGTIGDLISQLSNLTNGEERSEQFGQIHGTLDIEGQEQRTLLLRGLKTRKYGKTNLDKVKQTISIVGVTENGTAFHFFKEDQGGNKLTYGYVSAPCTTVVRHVDDWPTDIGELIDNDHFAIRVGAGERNYELNMDLDNGGVGVFRGDEWDFRSRIRIFRLRFNGKPGYGFVECGRHVHEHEQRGTVFTKQISLPQLKEPEFVNTDRLVLAFDELACQSGKLVGGKGSSLALMTTLDQKWLTHKFEVPPGVCIQKLAFEQHLNKNQSVKDSIRTLEDVGRQKQEGNLVEECNRIVKMVEATKLCDSLKTQLGHRLRSIFGDRYESIKFAIRSSAIGEDGEEMSAAGQNETFLGIKGIDEACANRRNLAQSI